MDHTARITFYDFSNLLYSSFYLAGFAECAARASVRFEVSHKAPDLEGLSPHAEWAHILLFRAEVPGDQFHFCIDTRDSAWPGEDRGNGYDLSLLQRVKYYGKVNYNDAALATDPRLAPFKKKILPVLPFFPVAVNRFPRLVPSRRMGWTPVDTLRRLKHLRDIPALDDIVAMRDFEEDIDIFFVVNVSGNPEHAEEDELRYRLGQEILENRDIRSVVGFVGRGDLPAKFGEFRATRYTLREYLSRVARSRVAIYVRGLHDCLSFKFGQLLALGKPIAGQSILNNADNVARFDCFPEQFGLEDPREIVARALDLLADPVKREQFGRANAAAFDSHFTPAAVVSDIMRRIGVAGRS